MNELFSTVLERNHLNLIENAQPSYKAVADFLNLDKDELSKATGIPKNSIRQDKMPRELEERLFEIVSLCEEVATFFKGDVEKTVQWFKLPNPMLGNISPRDMIRFGRYKKLMRFVQEAKVSPKRERHAG